MEPLFSGCADRCPEAAAAAREWLVQEPLLLDRYRTLLARPAWQEPPPRDVITLLSAGGIGLGQDQLLARAWLAAEGGEAEEVRALLAAEIAFWRARLADAPHLLAKMVAAARLQRHFTRSNAILRRLPPAVAAEVMPSGALRKMGLCSPASRQGSVAAICFCISQAAHASFRFNRSAS